MARLAGAPEPPRFGPSETTSHSNAGSSSGGGFGILGYLSVILALGAVAIVGWNIAQGFLSLQSEVNTLVQNVGGIVAVAVAKPFGIEPTPQLLQWLAPLLPLAASLVVWLVRLVLRRL